MANKSYWSWSCIENSWFWWLLEKCGCVTNSASSEALSCAPSICSTMSNLYFCAIFCCILVFRERIEYYSWLRFQLILRSFVFLFVVILNLSTIWKIPLSMASSVMAWWGQEPIPIFRDCNRDLPHFKNLNGGPSFDLFLMVQHIIGQFFFFLAPTQNMARNIIPLYNFILGKIRKVNNIWRVNDKFLGYFSDHPYPCPFNYHGYLRDDLLVYLYGKMNFEKQMNTSFQEVMIL